MSNIKEKEIGKNIDSTAPQDGAQEDEGKPELGVGATTEVPQCPVHQKQSDTEKKDPYEHLKTKIMGLTLAVAAFALFISFKACQASQRSAETADKTFRTIQRPYVSLGNRDGTLAEYFPPAKGEGKGSISLYFQNAGNMDASHFMYHVRNKLFIDVMPGRIGGFPPPPILPGTNYSAFTDGTGSVIGAHSILRVPVDPRAVPSPEHQWGG